MDIEKELTGLFHLGQTYWQQADSEYYSQNKKSDATFEKAKNKMSELSEFVGDLLAEHDESLAKLAAMERHAAPADKPAVAVPQHVTVSQVPNSKYAEGWNDCVDYVLAAAPSHSQQSAAITDDQILILSTCHMDEVFAESYCNDIINFGRAIEATVLGLHDRCQSHESEGE